MLFGSIHESFVTVKAGLFKTRKVQKKVYTFKVTHTGPIGDGIDSSEILAGLPGGFLGIADIVNKVYSFEKLEEAINVKQQLVHYMFVLYVSEYERNMPPYHIEKGIFEKDANYDKEYLKNKFG